jgi:hypothetical protein
LSTRIHSPPEPAARLYTILSAWQVAAVSFGCLCVRLWLKNYPPRDLEYYLREDPVLTRLVLLVQAMGLWALLLPVLYWWFARTRRNRVPFLMAILVTAGLTLLYVLATYHAFRMAFAPVSR